MPTLTAISVEAAKPGPTRRELRDSVVPGLCLVIQPSGAKSWALRYWHQNKFFKLTLGPYPLIPLGESAEERAARIARDPSSEPPDARGLARAARLKLAQGINPAAERKEAKRLKVTGEGDANLVKTVWASYVENYLTGNPDVKESTAARYKGIFAKHVATKWDDRRIDDLKKRDVLDILDAAKKHGPAAANSVFTALSAFFNWTVERDVIGESPMKGMKKPFAEVESERALDDDEIKIFWRGCDQLGPVFGPMFQLLLLTGSRRDEVASMEWREVDLEKRLWTIPGERTKNGKEHRVYLSDAALAILKSMPRIDGSKFVFSTSGDAPSSGFSKAKARLDKLTSDLPEWRLHDLRRTVATGFARLGVDLVVGEKCLNHISGSLKGVAKIYNRHDYADEMKAAWIAWAGHVTRIVSGEEASNVIPMRAPELVPA